MDSEIGDTRTRIAFMSDGSASIVVDQNDGKGAQAVTRAWYAEGGDIFIDYGEEDIEGEIMFGRTRYFFDDEELFSVYTLDGKEVSDYIVFVKSGIEEGSGDESHRDTEE